MIRQGEMQVLREPRRAVLFPVLVECDDDIRRHIARNICDSGIFIEADPPYALGTVVRVVFMYPGSDVELMAVGEVRHQSFKPLAGLDGVEEVPGVGIVFLRFEDGIVKPTGVRH